MDEDELVFHMDKNGDIMSGGYKVKSLSFSNTFKDLSLPIGLYNDSTDNYFDILLNNQTKELKKFHKNNSTRKNKNKKNKNKKTKKQQKQQK
jgi:hypothetical protein